MPRESFEGGVDLEKKNAALSKWVASGDRTYAGYRAVVPSADIIEYEDVKSRLAKSGI